MHSLHAIRSVTPADAPQVIALMRIKAAEDGIADEFFATAESLLSIPEHVTVLVAYTDEQSIVGYITYSFIYSLYAGNHFVWLDDIFVPTEARRSGVATLLVKAMCRHARRIGACRIDWIYKDTNDGGAAFYRNLGASVYVEYKSARLDQDGVHELATE